MADHAAGAAAASNEEEVATGETAETVGVTEAAATTVPAAAAAATGGGGDGGGGAAVGDGGDDGVAAAAAGIAAATGGKMGAAVIVIGMAGSGKTSFMQRLNAHLHQAGKPAYVVNLDPAVDKLPFEANIDIRDTVNYKEVMRQYELGPNGGIVTSLNLFATKFDKVLEILDERGKEHDHIIMDTPGQIEVFTWSASGQIIMETLASSFPTVLVYVIDTPRCVSPVTFMSNMLYACSILYKSKLPFILAFNKVDVISHNFCIEWMTDYDALYDAISQDTSYMASLSSSMASVLEEFYENLRAVGVSAHTGAGIDDFLVAVDEAVVEYNTEYKPLLEKLKAEKAAKQAAQQEAEWKALKKDMGPHGKVVIDGSKRQEAEMELPAEELPVGQDMSMAELEEQEERLSRGK